MNSFNSLWTFSKTIKGEGILIITDNFKYFVSVDTYIKSYSIEFLLISFTILGEMKQKHLNNQTFYNIFALKFSRGTRKESTDVKKKND